MCQKYSRYLLAIIGALMDPLVTWAWQYSWLPRLLRSTGSQEDLIGRASRL